MIPPEQKYIEPINIIINDHVTCLDLIYDNCHAHAFSNFNPINSIWIELRNHMTKATDASLFECLQYSLTSQQMDNLLLLDKSVQRNLNHRS